MARRVVSFDVGLKNLAFVVLSVADGGSIDAIERWGVIDVTAALPAKGKPAKGKPTSEALTTAIVESLDAEFFDPARKIDSVLVENQPSRKNPAMKAVQVAIVAYFATVRLHCACVGEIRLIGATRKLQGAAPTDYKQRKAMSVAACRSELTVGSLRDAEGASAALATLESAKKKDDLADAMLQALAYLRGPPRPGRRRPVPARLARDGEDVIAPLSEGLFAGVVEGSRGTVGAPQGVDEVALVDRGA